MRLLALLESIDTAISAEQEKIEISPSAEYPPSTPATIQMDRPYRQRMYRRRVIRRSKQHGAYVKNAARITAMRTSRAKKRW